MPTEKYIVQSRHKPGSYGWAMDQLDGGNSMRRPHWPYRDHSDGTPRPLFVYRNREYGELILAFSVGNIGDDYARTYEGLGTPTMGYTPSQSDIAATDWKDADTFDDEERDAVPIWRTVQSWGETQDLADATRREERTRRRARVGFLFVAFVFAVACAVATVYAAKQPFPKRPAADVPYVCTPAQREAGTCQ